MSDNSPEVMKWFTRARRFPQLIGRTPDGARIWGGPYTITQVVGAGVMLFAGTRTFGLWAHYGLLSNALLLLSVTYAVVWALGRIPVGSRNPLSVATGTLRALSAPPAGRVAGRPVRFRRPRQVRHRIVVLHPAPPAAARRASGPVSAAAGGTATLRSPALAPARRGPWRRRPVLRRPPAAPVAVSAPAPRVAPALTTVQTLLAHTSPAPKSPVPATSGASGAAHGKAL